METLTSPYYGIDVSKDTLWIALQKGENPKDKSSWEVSKIANTQQAIMSFLEPLTTKVQVIFEATGTYSLNLVFCLDLLEISYSMLSPQQSHSFAQSLKFISQDDARDAILLAYYGASIKPAQTLPESKNIHQLRQKRKHLYDLKNRLQGIKNQLHALSFDPKATKTVVDDLMDLEQIYQQKISKFEHEVCTLSEEELQKSVEKLQTIKGIGPVVAHGLVIATNGFKDFENVKQLAKFLGLIGKTKESGTSIHRKSGILKTGQATLRAALYMAASCAKRFNPVCKAFYEKLRAARKCHKIAIISVAHKLLRIGFAIVKNDTTFEADFAQTK